MYTSWAGQERLEISGGLTNEANDREGAMFKLVDTRYARGKRVAGFMLMAFGSIVAGAAMATNVFGGGSTLPVGGYLGWSFASSSPSTIFSTNVPGQTGAFIDPGSLIGRWAATSGNSIAFCQTGSVNGKKIFNHFDGVTTLVGATGACTGGTTGFGALPAPVDPHFVASEAPMSQDEFNGFSLGGKAAANGQPVQFPALVGSIAIAYNNPDVPPPGLSLSDATLCRIFSGQISDWSQLSPMETGLPTVLPSRTLRVVYPREGSGTTFSFANHLSTVCAPGPNGQVFQTDQNIANVLAQYGGVPWLWLSALGDPGVVTGINSNSGAIGFVASANVRSTPTTSFIQVARINGFNPYTDFPASLTLNVVLLDNVIVGRNANGTPHVQKMSPAAPFANCVLMVNPADYANAAGRYPIMAVSYLVANSKGNGADVTALRSLFASMYDTVSHGGVTTVGRSVDGFGTGYAFVNSVIARARLNACINS